MSLEKDDEDESRMSNENVNLKIERKWKFFNNVNYNDLIIIGLCFISLGLSFIG